jgi:disulfide bond formation protein DsbB
VTRKQLILLATAGSAGLLVTVWTFQAFGYEPCKLCHWQRWPHEAAVLIGIAALLTGWRVLPLAGALAAAATGAIGVYHTGVEDRWWPGPDTCTSGPIDNLSPAQLLDQIMAAPLVRCDEVSWQFLTLSMASYNALISFALAAIWLLAWRRAG